MTYVAHSLSIIRADLSTIRKVIADTRQAEPGRTMQAICLHHAECLADRIETELARMERAQPSN